MDNELYHYGIKGMKWGVRRKRETSAVRDTRSAMREAKANKKAANKEYRRAFNKATSLYGAYGPKSNQRAEAMSKAASKARKADKQYKTAKNQYKKAVNADNRRYSKSNRESDANLFGDRGVKRINKRMNKGSSYTSAVMREAGRKTVTSMLGAAGALAVSAYAAQRSSTGRAFVNQTINLTRGADGIYR